jgi:hypothetical protein
VKQNRELKAGTSKAAWRELAGPTIASGVFGAGTVAAFVFNLGWPWALAGCVLTVISLLVVMGSNAAQLPRGAIPVRCELEVESVEGDTIQIRVIAVVRVAMHGQPAINANELYGGRTVDDVGAAATALLESIVRAELGRKPRAELEQPTILDHATPPGWFKDAFVRMALVVDSLWVGPA